MVKRYAVIMIPSYEVMVEGLSAGDAARYCVALNDSPLFMAATVVAMAKLGQWRHDVAEWPRKVAGRMSPFASVLDGMDQGFNSN